MREKWPPVCMAVRRRKCWISATKQLQRKPHKFFHLTAFSGRTDAPEVRCDLRPNYSNPRAQGLMKGTIKSMAGMVFACACLTPPSNRARAQVETPRSLAHALIKMADCVWRRGCWISATERFQRKPHNFFFTFVFR